MKKIYYSILSVLLLCTSCDWLDVNSDPNKATAVDPGVLYNYATISWAANRCSGDLYIPLGFAGQTMSTGGSGGWGNVNVYSFSPYSIGNTWKSFYSSAGANLKQAIFLAEETSKPNVAAQAKIAFAELIYHATTLHGDIPYSEAWDIKNISYPKFDAQKDVLNNLISLLDEAIHQIDPASPFKIGEYDLAYKGDLNKWIRYANSLKLRIFILMVDKDSSKASLIADLLKENNMINSAADNFEIPFETISGKENPKFKMIKQYMNGVNLEFFANKYVLDPLKKSNDPRISRYFDMGEKATEYIGTGTNDEGVFGNASMISAYIFRADAPELFFSYQDQLFFEAEVYARGLGVAVDLNKANARYKEALSAAMLYYKVSEVEINAYMSNDFIALTAVPDPVKEIHLQQWINLMDRPLEAFTQWRRSGKEGEEVPVLTVPRRAVPSQLLRRWIYSPDETSANPNAPKALTMTDKVWFDE